ncbi:MAG: cyclic nucleotide-binding domain-containing protein [Deltaproteobacteria bacterium]|nr:cyclic nucleotide-binding domain-containing protein [Deltaproteobacteria bacterium]
MSGIDPATAAVIKDKAEALFAKGRIQEAASAYESISSCGDKDPRIYLRLGDILRKIGDSEAALLNYKSAAESFARLGFTIKAVAVCKMMLSIDPSLAEIQQKITKLCAGKKDSEAEKPLSRPGPETRPQTQSEAAQADSRPEESPLVELSPLPRTPLFSDFTEDEFIEVVKKARSRELAAGEYLFHEGDRGDSIYFVAEGEVEVVGRAKDGREAVVSTLREGNVFGEFGFFSNAKRSSGVRAAGKASVLELTKQDLDEIISRHKRVEAVLFDFYKERVVDRLMALSSIFSPMDAPGRKEILKRLTLVRFLKGAKVMKQGETGDTMHLIKEGQASVTVSGKDGSAVPVAELKEGDFFGEIALATNKPRTADVTARTDMVLVEFSKPVIRDVMAQYPKVKEILAAVIKERVSDALTAREKGAPLI